MGSDSPILKKLSAFTTDPRGGNPAGVWLGPQLPPPADMLRIAQEVGFSETAFAAHLGDRRFSVRYYSVEAEVSFCGHATIATGVTLGTLYGEGVYHLETAIGAVKVVAERRDGRFIASLTSVATKHRSVERELLADVLDSLRWTSDALDSAIPSAIAYGGAWHLVIAVSSPQTLSRLDYDFDRLKAAMLDADLTTVQLIWKERPDLYHSRNPFPVGGVVEDPATGAAAAAFGGYLRDAGLIEVPASFIIRQGEAMGRPSEIFVSVPVSGGITVSGSAVSLDT